MMTMMIMMIMIFTIFMMIIFNNNDHDKFADCDFPNDPAMLIMLIAIIAFFLMMMLNFLTVVLIQVFPEGTAGNVQRFLWDLFEKPNSSTAARVVGMARSAILDFIRPTNSELLHEFNPKIL